MRRKVIKQANQAYTITLPIEWVRENNLDGKSEIEVEISEQNLLLSAHGNKQVKKASFEVPDYSRRSISRCINALYARGVDEIEIIANQDITPLVIKSLNQTIGFALVSQKEGKYIIKDIGGANYSDLDEIFKRVFQVILLFYESAIKDIFGKQEETKDSLIQRDQEVNKFCLYLQRAINKKSYPDPINARSLFTYSFELEKIGDEIERLWRLNIEKDVKKTPMLRELVTKSLEGLSLAFDFYYQFNPKIAEKITLLRNEARDKSFSLKLDANTARFLHHAMKIIEDAADLSHLSLMRYL